MHSANTIEEFLEIVLDARFPGISEKQKVEATSKGYRIACPICGDSENKISSKRGNIYLNTNTYKCFNGGCRAFMSFGNFVSKYASEYNINIMDLEVETDSNYDPGSLNIENKGSNAIRDYLFDVGIMQHLPDLDYFTKRLGLIPLIKASTGSKVFQYMANRNIFDTEMNVDGYFKDSFDNKVYMVNHDYETKKVISISTRDIERKKFMVFQLSDLMSKISLDYTQIPDIELIDQLSNIFNVFNVDFRKPIKITEGPIDGSFLYNYLAIQGITKTSMLFDFVDPKNTYIVFDNDESGIESAIKAIHNGMNVFLWSDIMKILKKLYYKNMDKVLQVKDVNNLYNLIKANSNVNIRDFNNFVDKHFGNHRLDVFNL